METIKNATYGGERPLFASHNLEVDHVTITPGESALKCCSDIIARNCEFQGKYPFWHVDRYLIEDCTFTVGARAALWYGTHCVMRRCRVEAPKMFRELNHVTIEDTDFPDGEEMLWSCRNIRLRNVKIDKCDYLMMHSSNIDIRDYEQHGNYSFQYCRDVTIENADIHSKDAFWETENVTLRNCRLTGEYLGWHSRNLHLIDCHISGTQPLCYCENLVLENCSFDADADLAFEDSEVNAVITTPVTSIKNPRTGTIRVPAVGELIIDKNVLTPADANVIVG